MKFSYAVAVVSLVGTVCIAAPAHMASAAQQTAAPTATVGDDTIESRVEAILKKDSVLAPRNIDVESKHGQVTLTGSVRTAAEKSRAGDLAKITGVTGVYNEIAIKPNIDESKTDAAADKTKAGLNKAVDATAKGAEKTKEGVEKGVSASAKGVGKAADKTADAMDKTGDKLSDTSLSTSVKNNFSGEPLLKDTAIDVHTSDHVVTLKGTVGSSAAKARAEEIAARTKGVTRVVNDLVVESK